MPVRQSHIDSLILKCTARIVCVVMNHIHQSFHDPFHDLLIIITVIGDTDSMGSVRYKWNTSDKEQANVLRNEIKIYWRSITF